VAAVVARRGTARSHRPLAAGLVYRAGGVPPRPRRRRRPGP
jgi:hypothetical protein